MRRRISSPYWAISIKLLELLFSIGIAWLFKIIYPSAAEGLEWVVGFILFLSTQIIELSLQLRAFSDRRLEEIGALSSSLQTKRKSDLLLLEALKWCDRRLTESEIHTAWRQLCWLSEEEYLVTNFLNPSSFFESGHAQDAITLQKAKLINSERFSVFKILIWKDVAEMNSPETKCILELQQSTKKCNLDVREITFPDVEKRGSLKNDLKKKLSGNIDFAVFDSSAVVIWHLDAQREVKYGQVVVSEVEIEKFRDFFFDLRKESDPMRSPDSPIFFPAVQTANDASKVTGNK